MSEDEQASSLRDRTKRFVLELREQIRTAGPTLVALLLYKFPWLISLRFVGGIGTQELAAAALASTVCDVTGLSIAYGLSSALTTLAAQARGSLVHRKKELLKRMRTRSTLSLHSSYYDSRNSETGALLKKMEGTKNGISDYQSTNEASWRGDSAPTIHGTGSNTCSTNEEDSGKPLLPLSIPRTGNNSNSTNEEDSGKPLLPLVYLYRGLLVQFLFVFPIGLWWLSGTKSLLIALGQEDRLSSMTESYLRILVPGLWAYSLNWTVTAWLQAIEMADVPAYAAGVGLASHIPLNFFFIYTLGFGYLGVAVATVTFQMIQPFLMLVYVFAVGSGRKRLLDAIAASAIGRYRVSFWIEAKEAIDINGIKIYLGLALPGVIIISEWWASQVAVFLAGRMLPYPDVALGAMAIYQSVNTFAFMFPVAWGVAGATRVGNLLGAGDAGGAGIASSVSIFCSTLCAALMGIILFFSPHTFFPSLFAPGEDALILETSRTIPLLAIYVFADGIQSAYNGTIRGCGQQPRIVPVVVIAYWVVGVPLAYYIAFIRYDGYMCSEYFCGVVGLVTGMTVGTWVHMLLLGVIVFYLNWDVEAARAKERMDKHDEDEAILDENVQLDNTPTPVLEESR